MNQRIEDFLFKATESLRGDRELQLDARAELAAHAEEKLEELTAENRPADEAAEQTVKSMGDPLALAAELYDANRRRMNIRAQLRFFTRFALAPLAILSMALSADLGNQFGFFSDYTSVPERKALKNLTEQEILILRGDLSRPTYADQQKAIWESEPTNKIYFANYFNQVADTCHDAEKSIPAELLKRGRAIDPDNALYLYIEARQILDPIGKNRPALRLNTSRNTSEASRERPDYVILDRDRLDRGMALIETALTKPYSKHYSVEMLNIRLRLIPAPRNMSEQAALIGFNAGALHFPLPLSKRTQNSRMLPAYGDILLEEGKIDRADFFLNAWKLRSRHIAASADTLIEALLAAVITKQGDTSAAVYEHFGYMDKAERMRNQTAIAQAPQKEFQSLRKNPNKNNTLRNHGSMLAQIGIPSIPEYGPPLTAKDFEPSRRVELTLFTRGIVLFIGGMMIIAMATCGLIGLRFRFSPNARVIPVLLLPDARSFAKLLTQSVLLPGLLFLAFTRLAPWSGHAFSIFAAPHKLIVEFTLLGLALLALPALLGARRIRMRCEELGIPTDQSKGRLNRFLAGGAIALCLLWLAPAGSPDWVAIATGGLSVTLLLALPIAGVACMIRERAGGQKFALFYGTLFRSLIPLFAAALLVLNLVSSPLLRSSEAKYLQQDTLFNIEEGGMTAIETRAVRHIRQQLLDALETIESNP